MQNRKIDTYIYETRIFIYMHFINISMLTSRMHDNLF